MNVLFDAYWWVEGPFSNRTVQREFVFAWAAAFPEDDLHLLVPTAHLAAARADAPAAAHLVPSRLRPHGLAMAVDGARLARRLGVDWTVTHNFSPLSGRSAVFIHDVLFQTDPDWFTPSERIYFGLMPRLARRARVVLTSSRTEAARIAKANPRLPPPVPVGLAVRTELRRAESVRPAGVPDEFLLTVGRLNVRKNLDFTLRAALVGGRLSAQRPLVVVGESDGRAETLAPTARAAVADGAVLMLGGISDGQLAWLYGNAQLFVFLSLDEGFGLPPVEALAFGCPALVSDIPVLRETLGDRVRYVSPRDLDAAATAIASAATAGGEHRAVDLGLSWHASVTRIRTELESR